MRRGSRYWPRVGGQGAEPGQRESEADSGSALLVVIGATAALSVVASLLLLSSLAAYEATGYRADRAQAELLAQAALGQTGRALRLGVLPLPRRAHPVSMRNGFIEPGGTQVPVATFPTAAPGWPATTARPPGPDASILGVGALVTLQVVVGPRGDLRERTTEAGSGRLIEATVISWYRRSRVTLRGRFVLLPDGSVQRLD